MTSSATPRIAFLDVDGTILEHGGAIAASTVEAVQKARAAGHLVYLSTGRSAGDINPRVAAIGFDGAITNGGAQATSGDEVVVNNNMPREALEQLIAYFEANGIRYVLQSHNGVYASAEVQAIFADLISQLGHGTTTDENRVVSKFTDISKADFSQVAKVTFISDEAGMVEHAQGELGEEFHVVPGSMPLPGGSNGEIAMRGTNKGAAILAVLDHLGIDPSLSIGVGDSWNDVEMFEVCGVGIAMGNAEPALKELANEVTTGVLDDGVWNAFVKHGLV